MVVGVLRLELAVYESHSLKEKRRVVKSLKDRLIHRFNASIAEVDALDSWQRAVLGVAVVGNESEFVRSCLDKIVDYVRLSPTASLISYDTELL
jgi:uncharacterized protein